jgi:hypothetical protein
MLKNRELKKLAPSRNLTIAGLALLVAVVLIVKEKPQATGPACEFRRAQLGRTLEAGQPVLLFFNLTRGCEC